MRGVSDSVLRMSSIKSALLQGGLSAKDRAWVKILVGFSSIVHLMWCSNPYRFFLIGHHVEFAFMMEAWIPIVSHLVSKIFDVACKECLQDLNRSKSD